MPLVTNVEVMQVVLGTLSYFNFDMTLVTPEAIAHEKRSYGCPEVARESAAEIKLGQGHSCGSGIVNFHAVESYQRKDTQNPGINRQADNRLGEKSNKRCKQLRHEGDHHPVNSEHGICAQ